jgi:putative RecB family exonuclease
MTLAELKKEPHLSASSINDYVDCGLLYKLGRIDRIRPEFTSDALEFGSVIHKVLADFYQEKMLGNKMLLKQLHVLFEEYWRDAAEGREDIRYQEGKSFDSLLLEGKELLTAYYEKVPDDDFKILAIEEAFRFYLDDLPIPIIGAIDLLEEDSSDTIIITDFKTTGRAYSADEVDNNFQLTLYQLGMKKNGSW